MSNTGVVRVCGVSRALADGESKYLHQTIKKEDAKRRPRKGGGELANTRR